MASRVQIEQRLRDLERNNRRLIPGDVLDDARDPDSPLHDQFEWDDTEAAEKYRLQQASKLIRLIRLEITVREIPLRVPAYVRDPSADLAGRGFRHIMELRTDEEAARSAIVDEMRRVASAVKRAKTLAAALGFADDLERINVLAASIVERSVDISDRPGGEA